MTIYHDDKLYCVYLTTYLGNKMPPFYIGSTSLARIFYENYHGTVRSKQYQKIWNSELHKNPHLFKTSIVTTFSSREEATESERRLQIKLKVVKSPMYINCAIAAPNGFFGTKMNGELNPQYGKEPWNKGKKTGPQTNESNTRRSNSLKGKKQSKLHVSRRSNSMKGKNTNPQSESHILKKSKTYIVITPSSEKILVINLRKFCRDNNIHQGALSGVARGQGTHHKGFVAHLFQAD